MWERPQLARQQARGSASRRRACKYSSWLSSNEFLGPTLHVLTKSCLLGGEDLHVLARDHRLGFLFECGVKHSVRGSERQLGFEFVEVRQQDALPLPVERVHEPERPAPLHVCTEIRLLISIRQN